MKKIIIRSGVLAMLVLLSVMISGCMFVSQSNIVSETREEICAKVETGESMSLSEARQIASASECTAEGPLKEDAMCNSDTGTWWLGLNIEKELCNPACVVNVATRTAEINWRCTGAIPE